MSQKFPEPQPKTKKNKQAWFGVHGGGGGAQVSQPSLPPPNGAPLVPPHPNQWFQKRNCCTGGNGVLLGGVTKKKSTIPGDVRSLGPRTSVGFWVCFFFLGGKKHGGGGFRRVGGGFQTLRWCKNLETNLRKRKKVKPRKDKPPNTTLAKNQQ